MNDDLLEELIRLYESCEDSDIHGSTPLYFDDTEVIFDDQIN